MRRKAKPKKPNNPHVWDVIHVDDCETLESIVDRLNDKNIPLSAVTIHVEYVEYDYCEIELKYTKPKYTDEEFINVLKKYKTKLEEWNKWYNENRTWIEEDDLKKKTAAEVKLRNKLKRLKADKAKIELQIQKLE